MRAGDSRSAGLEVHEERAGQTQRTPQAGSHRRRDSATGTMGLSDRGALHAGSRHKHADGYGVGEGRTHERAVHRAGPSGNRSVPQDEGRFADLESDSNRTRAGLWAQRMQRFGAFLANDFQIGLPHIGTDEGDL